ncbi:MAG: hypothetical protein ACLUAO_00715 [Streptococcus sp.]
MASEYVTHQENGYILKHFLILKKGLLLFGTVEQLEPFPYLLY